jgi:CHAT domain-containing protein
MLNGDKYQAFRKAQEKLMKDYSDPYYWAAFIMLD